MVQLRVKKVIFFAAAPRTSLGRTHPPIDAARLRALASCGSYFSPVLEVREFGSVAWAMEKIFGIRNYSYGQLVRGVAWVPVVFRGGFYKDSDDGV
jgi:hypothetical protein